MKKWLQDLLGTRAARLNLMSATGLGLAALLVALAMMIGQWAYLRLDLSKGRIYSLSPASKKLLKTLEDPLVVRAYVSDELPIQYAFIASYLRDLLKEYRRHSKGRVHIEFVPMSEEPDKKKSQAMQSGVRPAQFNILEKNRYEVREGFLGVVISYLDKSETIPFVQKANELEYDITSRIRRLVQPEKPKLVFFDDKDAVARETIGNRLLAQLEENYEVLDMNLASLAKGESPWPKSVSGVFFLGPRGLLEDKEIYVLDRLASSGAALTLALDRRAVDLRSFVGPQNDDGLDHWLAHHGLILRKDLTFDHQNQMIQVQQRGGILPIPIVVPYPPFIVARDLNRKHPAVRDLDNLILPFVGAIEVNRSSAAAQAPVAVPLIRSSKVSWAHTARFGGAQLMLNPFTDLSPQPNAPKGPFNLAVTLQGNLKPYFDKAPDGMALVGLPESRAPSRLVVLGTSRFIHGSFNMPDNNKKFLLNLADWMAQDDALIAIRSKSIQFRTLREVSGNAKRVIQVSTLFASPLLFFGIGAFSWRRRQRLNRFRKKLYGPRNESENH